MTKLLISLSLGLIIGGWGGIIVGMLVGSISPASVEISPSLIEKSQELYKDNNGLSMLKIGIRNPNSLIAKCGNTAMFIVGDKDTPYE